MAHDSAPPDLDADRLMLIMQGHAAFQMLWAGVSLGLFDRLSQAPGLSLQDIAAALGLDVYPTRVLVGGLAAIGVLRKEDGGYRNADLVDRMLVGSRPDSLAPVLGWQAHIVYPGLQDFVESLRAGRNAGLERFAGSSQVLYGRLAEPANAQLEAVFHDAMSALSAQANQHLLAAADLSGVRHLVDVGGGDGTNVLALCRKHPSLRATVFDGPTVCGRAREKIAAAGLSDRIDTHAGNLFEDPFPSGCDAFLFAHMFTIWSPEKHRFILKKCRDSLPPGGRVLIFNMMTNDDEAGPVAPALGSAYFLAIATGEGMLYPWKDYEAALRDAGFADVQRIGDLPMEHGLLIGTV